MVTIQTVVGLTPNLQQCLQTCLQICGSKRLGCHDLNTVSRCCTRGESENCTGEKAHKGCNLDLKPDITQSQRQGYQWPHEKDLCPPKKKEEITVTYDQMLSRVEPYGKILGTIEFPMGLKIALYLHKSNTNLETKFC